MVQSSPSPAAWFFFLISGNLTVCCCDKTNISMFFKHAAALFCRASAQKRHPSPLYATTLLKTRTESVRRDGGAETGAGHSAEGMIYYSKNTKNVLRTQEQTEQIQIKHVRNEKTKKSKPTKLDLAVGEVLW